MGKKINAIISRLEGLSKCDTRADCHGDVNFEESELGEWVSIYDIEELITEIKEGIIQPPKPAVEEKPQKTTALSIHEQFQLEIDNLEKEIKNLNSMRNYLNNINK